jgi:Ras-related protein Rab-6A
MEDAEAKAKEHDIMFIETSAKGGVNIKALFRKIAGALPGLESVETKAVGIVESVDLDPTKGDTSASAEVGCGAC